MRTSQIAILAVLLLALLAITGMVIAQVGGSSIRTSGQVQTGQLALSSSLLLPGVPTKITLDSLPTNTNPSSYLLLLKTASQTYTVSEPTTSQLSHGSLSVVIPCDSNIFNPNGGRTDARILLINNLNQSLVAQSNTIELLPPGPDCFFRK